MLLVHRMRNGLHRNICASNIPVVDSQCAQVEEPKGMRTAPLFIEDVVRAVARFLFRTAIYASYPDCM